MIFDDSPQLLIFVAQLQNEQLIRVETAFDLVEAFCVTGVGCIVAVGGHIAVGVVGTISVVSIGFDGTAVVTVVVVRIAV